MNNNRVRDFYVEEAEYEKSVVLMKTIIQRIISINLETLKEKINYVNDQSQYNEFIDLLVAVLGKETDKYYFCDNDDDVKYYNLVMGEVYRIDNLNVELQGVVNPKKELSLQARAGLAKKLLPVTKKLKDSFALNLGKSDGSLATFDSYIIKEEDITYLENLIIYLENLIDKTGRLKILVAERDVYALEFAKEKYSKKSSIEKWFYKTFNKENQIINDIAEKKKAKK